MVSDTAATSSPHDRRAALAGIGLMTAGILDNLISLRRSRTNVV